MTTTRIVNNPTPCCEIILAPQNSNARRTCFLAAAARVGRAGALGAEGGEPRCSLSVGDLVGV